MFQVMDIWCPVFFILWPQNMVVISDMYMAVISNTYMTVYPKSMWRFYSAGISNNYVAILSNGRPMKGLWSDHVTCVGLKKNCMGTTRLNWPQGRFSEKCAGWRKECLQDKWRETASKSWNLFVVWISTRTTVKVYVYWHWSHSVQ